MEHTAGEVWSRILDGARTALPEQAFRTWLAPTQAVAISQDLLVVCTPNPFAVDWVEDKYAELLTGIAADPDRPVAHLPMLPAPERPVAASGTRIGGPVWLADGEAWPVDARVIECAIEQAARRAAPRVSATGSRAKP